MIWEVWGFEIDVLEVEVRLTEDWVLGVWDEERWMSDDSNNSFEVMQYIRDRTTSPKLSRPVTSKNGFQATRSPRTLTKSPPSLPSMLVRWDLLPFAEVVHLIGMPSPYSKVPYSCVLYINHPKYWLHRKVTVSTEQHTCCSLPFSAMRLG